MKTTTHLVWLALTSLLLLAKSGVALKKINLQRMLKTPNLCSEKNRVMVDKLSAHLLTIGEYGRPFPTNQPQLNVYCRDSIAIGHKLFDYVSKCFSDEVRNLAKVMLFSTKAVERNFCKRTLANGTRKMKQLISHMPCTNKYVRSNDTCMVLFTRDVENILHLPKSMDSMKIPYMCCRYVHLFDCIDDFFRSHRQKCARDSREMIMDFIRSLFQSLVDFTCGEYNDQSDKCSSLPEMPKAKIPADARKYYSQIFVIIDMIMSINQD